MKLMTVTLALATGGSMAMAQNRIDTQLPSAPELAAYDSIYIGVKTLEMTNPD